MAKNDSTRQTFIAVSRAEKRLNAYSDELQDAFVEKEVMGAFQDKLRFNAFRNYGVVLPIFDSGVKSAAMSAYANTEGFKQKLQAKVAADPVVSKVVTDYHVPAVNIPAYADELAFSLETGIPADVKNYESLPKEFEKPVEAPSERSTFNPLGALASFATIALAAPYGRGDERVDEEARYSGRQERPKWWQKPAAWITAASVAACGGIYTLSGLYNNEPGVVGTEFNKVTGDLDETDQGLHWRAPFFSSVVKYDSKIQKFSDVLASGTKDTQEVNVTIAMQYHIAPKDAMWLREHVAGNYRRTIMEPQTSQAVKSVVSIFTAEETISHRDNITELVESRLAPVLREYRIQLDDVQVPNIELPQRFIDAIEDKKVAEQRVLTERILVEAENAKADQRIAQARGDGESLRIRAEANADAIRLLGPQYSAARFYDGWDGTLPLVLGSDGGSILLNALSSKDFGG